MAALFISKILIIEGKSIRITDNECYEKKINLFCLNNACGVGRFCPNT
jgi:hypothetical protein